MDFKSLISKFGSGIDLNDFTTSNVEASQPEEKALFGGRKDEIAKLENDLALANSKAKKNEETTLYVVGGVIALFLLGIFKMK